MISIQENVSLRNKTTYRIGGPARYYCIVRHDSDVHEAIVWAHEHNQPLFVLGRGSNILVSDSGWNGLVIDMSKFSSIRWKNTTVESQGGALLHTLVKQSVERGFAGMEELAGIPGTIGGGLIMNAGAFNQTIAGCVLWVKGINLNDATLWHQPQERIVFGYRSSSLKEQKSALILGAQFQFTEGRRDAVRDIYSSILRSRNRKQPVDLPNCGSVFKRPEGNFAGALIEQCGFKGYTIGGARVSEKHANFIVNVNDASAQDVRKMIATIQKRVFEERGVCLEPEVIFVGEFDTPLFEPSSRQ